jgi:hypothetical protein
MDGPEQYQLADEVIRHLREAEKPVNAMTDFHNSIVDKSAQAFAKIAGRQWTFYVSQLSVIIGRPNKKQDSANGSVASNPRASVSEDMKIDIDLGPDMQVSRMHAQIAFDQEEEKWFVSVNGRNGLTLDNSRLDRGARAWLHSGHVISIMGTQMMFLLPDSAPIIHSSIQRLIVGEQEEESEPEHSNDGKTKLGRLRGRGSNAAQTSQPLATFPGQFSSLEYQHQPTHRSAQPGTPGKSTPAHPKSTKTSPSYGARGIMMESTEDIDYSVDSAKDLKPPHSYAAMIGQAILNGPEENATLSQIYEYIKTHYAYFRHSGNGWQNSVRHNLSLSKSFEKIPRRTDEPGKGMKWQIVPEMREDFLKKNYQPTRRGRQLISSGPSSPANNMGAAAQTEGLLGVIGPPDAMKRKRSRSATPPLSSFPTATESFTPDRGPMPSFLRTGNLPQPAEANALDSANTDGMTPTHDRGGSASRHAEGFSGGQLLTEGLRGNAFNSPPTLTSTAYDGQSHLFTPLVTRQKIPANVQQSTCKVPSFYAKELFSSPAPFWKYLDIGGTPARLPDLSPSKPVREEDVDRDGEGSGKEGSGTDVEGDDKPQHNQPQPSSPPALDAGGPSSPNDVEFSPTRTVSRPVSRNLASAPFGGPESTKPDPNATTPSKQPTGSSIKLETTSQLGYRDIPAMRGISAAGPLGAKVNPYGGPSVDDDDDERIDLTM